MKTVFALLLLLVSGSAFGQALNLDKAPLLDAPGPGYRQDANTSELTVKEAVTLARAEVQARSQTTIYLAGSYISTAKELGLPINKTPIVVDYLGENDGFVTFRLEGTQYKVPVAAVLLISIPEPLKPAGQK